MKTNPFSKLFSPKTSLTLVILTVLWLVAFAALNAQAANQSWSGSSTNANWNTGPNWQSGNVPAANDLLFFGFAGSAGVSLTNDITAGRIFNGLTYQGTGDAFTLYGNSFGLNGGITNSGTGAQLISNNITLKGNETINANTGTIALAGAIDDGGNGFGLTKLGTGINMLSGVNTFGGAVAINSGTLRATTAGALPSTAVLNFRNATNGTTATLDIQGLSQTLANLSFSNNGTANISLTGTSGSALTVSPVVLLFAPFATTNNLTVNMSGLSSFIYNNSGGAFTANNGTNLVSNSTGQTTVTLAGGSNLITAATLNVGNTSPASGVITTTMNLGTNNTFNAGTINVGAGRTSDTIQFASGITNGTLIIAGSTGAGSLATFVSGGHDSFSANDRPVDLFDVTAGTLNAQFNTVSVGKSNPTANMTANRGITSTSSFKMGAGTLTAASMTLAVINAAAGDTGSFNYNITNTALFSITNGGAASITNMFVGINNYAGNLSSASSLSATVRLDNGATLNSASIQKGTITAPAAGTLNVTQQIIWGDGTIGNIPGGNLSVGGVAVVLSGAANAHKFNVSSGQTGTISAWISGTGSLTVNGAGAAVLSGQNSFNGSLIMASTNTLTLPNVNTYSGNTVVSNGTLILSGSITSPSINVQSNAVFDVSPLGTFTLGASQSLTGNGSVNGSVSASSGGQIIPGGTGVAGSLTFSNDLALNGQSFTFDLSANPASGNDQINVGGMLTLNANTVITVNELSGSLGVGTYTLLTYSSLNTNGVYNFLLSAPRGATLDIGANALTLVVSASASANLTWNGDGVANSWDLQVTTNWLNAGNPDVYFQNDNVLFNDTGSNSPDINLTTTLSPNSVTVNATQNYAFSGAGQLSGAMTLTKNGTGTLTLNTSNSYSGGTLINNGTVQLAFANTVAALPDLSAGTGPITNNATLNITNSGGTPVYVTITNPISGSGIINLPDNQEIKFAGPGSMAGFNGNINIPAGTTTTAKGDITASSVNLSSNATITIATGGSLWVNGSTVTLVATNNVSGPGNVENFGAIRVDGSATISGPVNLLGNTAIGGSSGSGTISGVISDGNNGFGITKVGGATSTLILLAANTYTGGTTISNGTLSIGNGVSNGSLPAAPPSVTNYATLLFNVASNTTVTPLQEVLGPGTLGKLGDGILTLTVSNGFAGGVTTGNGSGSGTSGGIIRLLNPYAFGDPSISKTVSVVRAEVRLEGGMNVATNIYFQTSAIASLTGPGAGYVALRNVTGTNTIPNTIELVTGAGNSEFSSDAGLLVFNGPIFLGLTSSRTAIFSGAGNGIINGVMTNQTTNALSIQKSGTGVWTLTAANSYTGSTTVGGGSLLVHGSVAAGGVTVQSAGTLGGSGTIGGTTTVQGGGVIQGGDANYSGTLGTTTLALGNNSTAVSYSRFDIAAGGKVAATTLNVSGTNTVQILDPSLTIGTNTLFTYTGSIGGTSGFGGFQLGTLPTGVTAHLADTGSAVQLAVTSLVSVNTNSPVLTNSFSGGALNLSWPADHLGWRLQVQTNALSAGLGGNWFTWPNSTNVTAVSIPLNPASPTVFFRLVYP